MKNVFLFILFASLFVSCSESHKKTHQKEKELPSKLSTNKIPYTLGNQVVYFGVYQKNKVNTTYFNMHDDENTAVKAAKLVIDSIGGKLIEILASGDRYISFSYKEQNYSFDPNRIYTSIGVKKTLKDQGAYSKEADSIVSHFANFIVDSILVNTKTIVTLHNNTADNYSINSYKKGSIYEKDATKVYSNPKQDPDDFFYIADSLYFYSLKDKGYNALLQDNSNVADDGSLSVYCGYKQIRYINVEAQKGHLQEQIQMLYSLREILDK